MADLKLSVQEREPQTKGQRKDLRAEGIVPAIVYGLGKKNEMVKVEEKEIRKIFKEAGSENFILTLTIEKGDKKGAKKTVIVKDIQRDTLENRWLHVDFQEISLVDKLKAMVEVIPMGTCVGVVQEGGALERTLREVEVECLPTDIPERIEVDITNLHIGNAVHVGDLKVSDKVRILNDPELPVISVVAAQQELEAVKPDEAEQTQPEVIGEKKEEGEEGAEAEKDAKAEGKEKGKAEGKDASLTKEPKKEKKEKH
jgi:large subunit ribosomal protein L25